MPSPFPSIDEHIEAEFALLLKRIELQIYQHWELGILPKIKDEFSGTFISDSEVDALLKESARLGDKSAKKLEVLRESNQRSRAEIDSRCAESTVRLPLAELRKIFGLNDYEYACVVALLAVDVNPRHRNLMRYLVNEASRLNADLGLLDLLVFQNHTSLGHSDRAALCRSIASDSPLVHFELLQLQATRIGQRLMPFLARPVCISPRVISWLYGNEELDSELPFCEIIASPSSGEDLLFDNDIVEQLSALVLKQQAKQQERGDHEDRPSPITILRGRRGSGRFSLAQHAAHLRNCRMIRVSSLELPRSADALKHALRSIDRDALLLNGLVYFHDLDALADDCEAICSQTLTRELATLRSPVLIGSQHSSAGSLHVEQGALVFDLPTPSESIRLELWKRAIDDSSAAKDLDLRRIAGRYPVPPGLILESAANAQTLAEARKDGRILEMDIHLGLRHSLDARLSGLGQRIHHEQEWTDLVLPSDAKDEIREFIARVKHKKLVYEQWGFARKLSKGLGLSALFYGAPGTGKTMVAGIIARELKLDLYQIDLSRIVSKYIGETEKNLSQLFDAAESGHAILLFDEADSMFAKRTEVKSSVDRYANLEVNYLLQRMEAFDGITILTTNLDSSIDEAFRRRLSFRINFPFPEVEDRERLWKTIIPTEAKAEGDIDYLKLGEKYEMSGGFIRNAVLRAAFLAADAGTRLNYEHLLRAANLEYAAMGKVVSRKGL